MKLELNILKMDEDKRICVLVYSKENKLLRRHYLSNKNKYRQGYENTLTFKNVRVTEGDNEVKEVGVVWLESDEDEEPINPTYKNNDGRKRYTGAYYEPFTFELDDIEDYCTYRLYVRDRDGLYAYSSPITITANEFSITMDISE